MKPETITCTHSNVLLGHKRLTCLRCGAPVTETPFLHRTRQLSDFHSPSTARIGRERPVKLFEGEWWVPQDEREAPQWPEEYDDQLVNPQSFK